MRQERLWEKANFKSGLVLTMAIAKCIIMSVQLSIVQMLLFIKIYKIHKQALYH